MTPPPGTYPSLGRQRRRVRGKTHTHTLLFLCVRVCTWCEAHVRDGLAAMMEAQKVLQCVGVHHQHAAVTQSDRQCLPIRGEGTAAPPCDTHTHTLSSVWRLTEAVCVLVGPTSLQLADGDHAVIGRRLPQTQRPVIADGSADGEEGVGGQTPHLTLHMTLHTHFTSITVCWCYHTGQKECFFTLCVCVCVHCLCSM